MAAAEGLTGRNVFLGIGKQTAFGTPAAPTKWFEPTDVNGIIEEYDWKKSNRRIGTRFKPLGYKTGRKVPISFTVEMNAQNCGLLLTLAAGSDSAAADGAAYKHTISFAENLSYFTVIAKTDDVADDDAEETYHRVYNCKVKSFKIDVTVDDIAMISIEAEGTTRDFAYASKAIAATLASGDATVEVSSTVGIVAGQSLSGTDVQADTTVLSVTDATHYEMSKTASGTGARTVTHTITPSFPTSKALRAKSEEVQGKLEIGATTGALAQFDETNEFHLSVSNGVSADMRIDNTAYASALREGDSEITGSVRAMYNRNTYPEIAAFIAGTIRALRVTLTSVETAASGKYFTFIFTTDRAQYSGTPTSWDPDVISTELSFEVEKTTSYPTFEIINADSASY